MCANSWDFSNKPTIKRLDRSSLVYSIDSTQVKVASPLGGGIYIEVPYLADAGIVDVQITKNGLDLLKRVEKLDQEWEQIFYTLTKTEAQKLNALLDKLRG